MKLAMVRLRNFRRLEDVEIDFENKETVLVGPNNSGKTSATAALRLFLKDSSFAVHDFCASRIEVLNALGAKEDVKNEMVPSIEMDIWFSIDPENEWGRIAPLLHSKLTDVDEIGVRIKWGVKDAAKLKSDYLSAFPPSNDAQRTKAMTHYLSMEGNLKRHFSLSYFTLEGKQENAETRAIKPEEGKKALASLIRVDFVDAQRNINDQETGRSNRLSAAFATFYRSNLEQASASEDANRVIDENNDNLTKHYETHFNGLMSVIQNLGVPSVNDRQLKIVSSLSPATALSGNTTLLYVDTTRKHELPEAYNGLGFKNLIYMAIRISHYHLQWMETTEKRPLCQVIFIEEPEAHLHAQIQRTFISNIWQIVRKASVDRGEEHMVPQIGITTHSSHILDTVEFKKARYFQRCPLDNEGPVTTTTLNGSKVLSLREFEPHSHSKGTSAEKERETLRFLERYMKLTHCDLFFADAAILVEGTVEKLLLPKMIEKVAPGLKSIYVTILEVGGAHAHRFAGLLKFLGIPYVVITDLDSVDPTNNRKVCRADTAGAVSSNASLKHYLSKSIIRDLANLNASEHIADEESCYVAFPKPINMAGHERKIHGRTFEDTFAYQNISLIRDKSIDMGVTFSSENDFEHEYQVVFERVKSGSFKKTEFALDVVSSMADWDTPDYIADGLKWLEKRTAPVYETGTA